MQYQIAFKAKQGDWVKDRSPLRTYETRKAVRAAIAFFVVKDGVKIVRKKGD